MRRRFSWQVYVAALFLSLVLSLAAGEITLRVLDISYPVFWKVDEQLGIALRPNTRGWFREEGGAFVHINAYGMRDLPRPQVKPPGTYRIAVLGDSFVEGLQVPQPKTFTAVLERLLSEPGRVKGRNVEVLNFGCSGYGTGQELLALTYRVANFKPDLVLVAVLTGNDLADNERELDPLLRRPYFVWKDDELVLDDSFRDSEYFQSRRSVVLDYLAVHCRLFQFANALRRRGLTALGRPEGKPPPSASRDTGGTPPPSPPTVSGWIQPGLDDMVYLPPPDELWKRIWRTTERLLVKMRDVARVQGAQFGVLVLTNGIEVHPDAALRASYARSLGAPDLTYPSKRIESFLAASGIPVLNLTEPLRAHADRTGEYLHGFAVQGVPGAGHYNELGHRVVAETAMPWILRQFLPAR